MNFVVYLVEGMSYQVLDRNILWTLWEEDIHHDNLLSAWQQQVKVTV